MGPEATHAAPPEVPVQATTAEAALKAGASEPSQTWGSPGRGRGQALGLGEEGSCTPYKELLGRHEGRWDREDFEGGHPAHEEEPDGAAPNRCPPLPQLAPTCVSREQRAFANTGGTLPHFLLDAHSLGWALALALAREFTVCCNPSPPLSGPGPTSAGASPGDFPSPTGHTRRW